MAMDGLTLASSIREMEGQLLGARIEKIYQPERDELILALRGSHRLLLSSHAANCRAQLTKVSRQNPAEPPMFCMLLRKYIQNGRIAGFSQPHFDRVLKIEIAAADDFGEPASYFLIAEIMGKHSNIVLVKNGVVIDSIRHVTPSISSVRVLMPGVPYAPPPKQDKADPRAADESSIRAALEAHPEGKLGRTILSLWSGLSPAAAEEIALRAAQSAELSYGALDGARKALCVKRVAAFFEDVRAGRFAPTLTLNPAGGPMGYFAYSPISVSESAKKHFDSTGAMLDEYYGLREKAELTRRKGHALNRVLQNNIERCRKNLALQQDILQSSAKMEENRLFGELLTANAHALPKGARVARVVNYYDETGATVDIPMDPALSPAQNAQKYYKKYAKQSAAYGMAGARIKEIRSELDYLEGQLENLNNCTEDNELLEVREELIREGYVRPERGRKRPPKIAESKPWHYLASDGTDIYVGKNNLQNDRLTLRDAAPGDYWLHTKNIPGSHVIVKSGNPTEQTLLEAALLAAWHSQAKNSAQVPVDYTPRRFIKKPAGSRPGFVIFSTNRTLYVTPTEEAVKKLRQVN